MNLVIAQFVRKGNNNSANTQIFSEQKMITPLAGLKKHARTACSNVFPRLWRRYQRHRILATILFNPSLTTNNPPLLPDNPALLRNNPALLLNKAGLLRRKNYSSAGMGSSKFRPLGQNMLGHCLLSRSQRLHPTMRSKASCS